MLDTFSIEQTIKSIANHIKNKRYELARIETRILTRLLNGEYINELVNGEYTNE